MPGKAPGLDRHSKRRANSAVFATLASTAYGVRSTYRLVDPRRATKLLAVSSAAGVVVEKRLTVSHWEPLWEYHELENSSAYEHLVLLGASLTMAPSKRVAITLALLGASLTMVPSADARTSHYAIGSLPLPQKCLQLNLALTCRDHPGRK